MRAVVIGAGVGGLTAALALRRAGFDVSVHERSPELREVGSGLTLWVNAMRVLNAIGIGPDVAAAGGTVDRIENRKARGGKLKTLPVRLIERKFGAPSVGIHRGRLQTTLAAGLPTGVVRLGAKCVGFDQDAEGVTVRFADGADERADVLVGADGIDSEIRSTLLGRPQKRYAGYTCWRSAVHLDHPQLEPEVYTQLYGAASNFGIFPIGDGYWSWYGTKITPAGGAAGKSGADFKREALEQFRGWYAPVIAVIEATDEAAVVRQDIYDLKPITTWGAGRVAVLGDAAHATTPTLGQGGCLAIEDSIVLARELASNGDPAKGLQVYWESRRKRANGIVRSARRQGYLYHGPNRPVGAFRDVFLGTAPTPIAMRVVEKLMGYEP